MTAIKTGNLRMKPPPGSERAPAQSCSTKFSVSRTDVTQTLLSVLAQTLLSVLGLARLERLQSLTARGFGLSTDKSVCATSVPGLRRQAGRLNQVVPRTFATSKKTRWGCPKRVFRIAEKGLL